MIQKDGDNLHLKNMEKKVYKSIINLEIDINCCFTITGNIILNK